MTRLRPPSGSSSGASSAPPSMLLHATLVDADTAAGVNAYPPMVVEVDAGGTDIVQDPDNSNIIHVTAGVYEATVQWNLVCEAAVAGAAYRWTVFLDDWYDTAGVNDWLLFDEAVVPLDTAGSGLKSYGSATRRTVLETDRALQLNLRSSSIDVTNVKVGLSITRVGDLPNP